MENGSAADEEVTTDADHNEANQSERRSYLARKLFQTEQTHKANDNEMACNSVNPVVVAT